MLRTGEEFRQLVRRTAELWLIFVVPLVVAGTFLAGPVIRFLYGTAYDNSAAPFRILLWSAALVVLRWVYMDSLRATGHQALDLRCAITSASLNVALNILLIPHFGMIGAASATVFADLVWFVMSYLLFSPRRAAGRTVSSAGRTSAGRRCNVRGPVVYARDGLAVPASVKPAGVPAGASAVRQSAAGQDGFSTIKFPRTRVSISLLEKVLKALAGVFTIGSPFRLKDVLSTAGTPVACPKRSINW